MRGGEIEEEKRKIIIVAVATADVIDCEGRRWERGMEKQEEMRRKKRDKNNKKKNKIISL